MGWGAGGGDGWGIRGRERLGGRSVACINSSRTVSILQYTVLRVQSNFI